MSREVLHEVYFGKEKVAPLQSQFSKIRKKFAHKQFNVNINSSDKDIITFNRMMEKFFGFRAFSLYINPNRTLNAYALPVTLYRTKEQRRNITNALQAGPNGFRYDTIGEVDGLFTIFSGLLDKDDLTDEELFAILLHELGHNFFEAVTDKECKYSLISEIIEVFRKVNLFISSKIKIRLVPSISDIEDELDEINFPQIFGRFINFIKPSNFLKSASELKASITAKWLKNESMYDNMRSSRIDYTNEKFADTFAATYGYGAEIHSALFKMQDEVYSKYNMTKNPIIVFLVVSKLYFDDLCMYILNCKDEHPDGLARINVTTQYLRSELAKEAIDPKVKRDLLAQLDEAQEMIDDYINFPKDEDSYMIIRKYYSLLYKRFGGDRREQDTDNPALFQSIDKRYNDLMKGNK